MADVLLEVKHLKKYFPIGKKSRLHAVDDVSFTIERGKTLGVVGESGCGKSTMGRCVLRLIEPTEGEVWFDGQNICELSKSKMRALRKDMQIVFQDPFSSLDPRESRSPRRSWRRSAPAKSCPAPPRKTCKRVSAS